MELSNLKKTARAAIDAEGSAIIELSRYINNNPETAYKEKKAAAAITGFLSARNFSIERGIGGVETAFTADFNPDKTSSKVTAGKGRVPVALIAEYDALPGVGHGCGHNLIAAAAAAAAVGTAAALGEAETSGVKEKKGAGIRLIGTPAEEVLSEASGKTRLIEAGVFREVGSALMFHPWIKTGVALKDLGYTAFRIVFTGRPAHAAADPWNGRNALDAAVVLYNSISFLRQQLPPGVKLHCIMPEAGVALNVIPERAVVEVMLRSTELEDLKSVERRIEDCVSAAASAAGCTAEMTLSSAVKPIRFNRLLFDLTASNMQARGEVLAELPIWEASSDFGDVSHEIPAMSLLYKTHDEHTCWHSAEAATEAAGDFANKAMLQAAKILSETAIDILYG